MSEFLEDEEEIKTEEIDDFCCFDRMRRLIQKNKINGNYGSEEGDKVEKENLSRVIQIEAKINKIESNLMKENQKKM